MPELAVGDEADQGLEALDEGFEGDGVSGACEFDEIGVAGALGFGGYGGRFGVGGTWIDRICGVRGGLRRRGRNGHSCSHTKGAPGYVPMRIVYI